MADSVNNVRMSPEEFAKEAINIVEEAQERGITLRILGATAIYIHAQHSKESLEIYSSMGRIESGKFYLTDLDLIGYSSQKKLIAEYFEKTMKYIFPPQMKIVLGGNRFIYFHPSGLYHVDIFFDKLEYSHTIFFGYRPGSKESRLELDFPTISLADLVLEKLQIHEINRKDLVDLIVIFSAHKLCETSVNKECIDGKYISDILSDDWGFWYDATENLRKVKHLITEFATSERLTILQNAMEEIVKLESMIEKTPKTDRWLKRAKIGTRKPWYNKVDEL